MREWLHLSQRAHPVLLGLIENSQGSGKLTVGIDRGGRISRIGLGAGQISRIYKRIAKNTGLEDGHIRQISSHSMYVGAAQDLLNSEENIPIIM